MGPGKWSKPPVEQNIGSSGELQGISDSPKIRDGAAPGHHDWLNWRPSSALDAAYDTNLNNMPVKNESSPVSNVVTPNSAVEATTTIPPMLSFNSPKGTQMPVSFALKGSLEKKPRNSQDFLSSFTWDDDQPALEMATDKEPAVKTVPQSNTNEGGSVLTRWLKAWKA